MKSCFCKIMGSVLMVGSILLGAGSGVYAEGLLARDAGPSDLQKQELEDAYYRGYNDAKSGKGPVDYAAGGMERDGDVVLGAGRGALSGAAMGKLSDGDVGRAAAWGAGAGAIKRVVHRKREASQESDWASRLAQAYNEGYRKGVNERE